MYLVGMHLAKSNRKIEESEHGALTKQGFIYFSHNKKSKGGQSRTGKHPHSASSFCPSTLPHLAWGSCLPVCCLMIVVSFSVSSSIGICHPGGSAQLVCF